ncbi:hypothetical protein TNIN_210831 [Trichonephila inaurata madagascariensis]|uniref:Uncharacterized protein n=1 Tax=Trichonephila inaurata madagascariensis TaxID=2747483 RepID=A0A8X6WVY3_9ARAC|nr:hypothetical protein TNIN_210831 [Trichonephila inaurata madagascariensis]
MENVGVKQKKTNYVRSWNVKREEFTKCTFLDEWFEKFAKRQNSRFKGRKTKEKNCLFSCWFVSQSAGQSNPRLLSQMVMEREIYGNECLPTLPQNHRGVH